MYEKKLLCIGMMVCMFAGVVVFSGYKDDSTVKNDPIQQQRE